MERAAAHWRAGRYQAAADAWASIPDDPAARCNLGAALRILGRLDEAEAALRSVLATPERLRALTELSAFAAAGITEAELADLRAAPDDGPLFAAGRVLEAHGEYDAAFAAFAEGNRRTRAALPVRPEERAAVHTVVVDNQRRLYTAAFLRTHGGEGAPSRAPVFVVGVPRSGSTLVEHILASHPQAVGLGEVPLIAKVVEGRFPHPETAPKAPGHFRKMGVAYLAAAGEAGWKGQARVVDKTLANDVAVGPIVLMLPNATVLHAVRTPADACLSAFFTRFTTGNECQYALADTAAFFRRHMAVMDHWREVLPGKVADVSNEALAADPEGRTRALVEAVGLPWHDACLRPQDTVRPVTSASSAQVRRPVNAGSVGRWKRYERHLGPLLEALGPYAP